MPYAQIGQVEGVVSSLVSAGQGESITVLHTQDAGTSIPEGGDPVTVRCLAPDPSASGARAGSPWHVQLAGRRVLHVHIAP